MLQGRDILCFSYADWLGSWSTPQQIMSRLARRNRVLYVDQPRSFLYGLRARSAKGEGIWEGPALREVQPNLHVFHPPNIFLPVGGIPLPLASRLLQINGWLLAAQIRRAMRTLDFDQPILWDFSILHGEAAPHIPHALHVYDIADTWEGYITSRHGRELVRWADERISRDADISFPSTPFIRDAHAAWCAKQVLVPHGADFEHFSKAALPDTSVAEEVAGLPRPIIGCIGVIDPARFDEELIIHLARQRPDCSVVLVGPALPGVNLTRLRECANVYLTGSKAIEQLPNYLRSFDIALIPYKVNALTNSIFPLKLMEYLSAGKAVVSTALQSVREHADVVYIAESAASVVDQVAVALSEDGEPKRLARQERARAFSWEEIVRRKSEAVASALEE
jgi:glycosyltransferase involved in cell wall biosynthesis